MKKVFLLITLCFAFLSITMSCAKIEYNNTGTITGTVIAYKTGTNNPISGALITLIPSQKNTYTGVDGSFQYDNVEAGQYTLTVIADGFQANRKIVDVVAGETENVSVIMEPQQ